MAIRTPSGHPPPFSPADRRGAQMIHEAATSTAEKSEIPFAPEAVQQLEQVRSPGCAAAEPHPSADAAGWLAGCVQALEPIFKAMMEAAMANAVKDGRDAINEKDLEVVRKQIRAQKKKKK